MNGKFYNNCFIFHPRRSRGSEGEGNYSQKGLMHNNQSLLPPTRDNNIEIINNNTQNIK